MNSLNHYLITAIKAALAAGNAIIDVYQTDFAVDYKADNSPLTRADQMSNDIIAKYLRPFGIPYLSEEGKEIPYAARKNWDRLWIVDPLDGTKEFVNRNGEFTVNIALVENHRPILGVVYVPVKDLLYFAHEPAVAFKLEKASSFLKTLQPASPSFERLEGVIEKSLKLPAKKTDPGVFTIVGSRSHASGELEDFVRQIRREKENVAFVAAGSSMKFCLVAEGTADIYPRFGPTMEWDTAAGHAVAQGAGLDVLNRETGIPLTYNKENLLNPWFIVQPKKH